MLKRKKISFVIPIFNEEKSIEELYNKIRGTFKIIQNYNFEIIFVNDGSDDSSLDIVKKLRYKDPRIEIISFRKNLGKSLALNQGFRKAKGEIVVTMDGDLQDDPQNVPRMLEELNKGYDLVIGWKKERKDSFSKTIPSKVFNFFIRSFSGIFLHDFNSGLKIFRKNTISEIRLYGELHRFIPVLVSQKGFAVTEIPVHHNRRKYGKSKYGWARLIKGFFDFLTVVFLFYFGQRPLHLFGIIGIASILLGVIFGLYLSILRFQGYTIGNRPLLIFSVLLIISGIQMLSTGLIAEMIVSRSRSEERLPIDFESKTKNGK